MLNSTRIVTFGLLLIALATPGLAAQHEPCAQVFEKDLKPAAIPTEELWTRLNEQKESGCILGATDTTGIRNLYLSLHDPKPGVNVAVSRKQLFDQMLAQFDGIPAGECNDSTPTCVVGRHKRAIANARELLANGEPTPNATELGNWAVQDRDGSIGVSDVTLKGFLEQECDKDIATPRCLAAFEIAAKIVRSTEGTFQAIVAHQRPIIDVNAEFLSRTDKEWDAYFNDVSVQYPWELGVNSARFQRQLKKKGADPAKFPRAPSDKLVILHPVQAFEYADVGDEHSTQAAVVVELIGYERWRWRDGAAINRMGVSLAASFADVPGADAVGYGVVLHLPLRHFSVGAVWRNGDAGDSINLIFNADLAGLIEQYKNADVEDFLQPPK